MNHVALVGRFAKDPNFTDGDTPRVFFTLAVDRWGHDGVDFIDLVAFGKQAINIAEHKHKGDQVAVDGRLHQNVYDRNGERVFRLEVIADRVHFLSRAKGAHVEAADDDVWEEVWAE